MLGPDAVPLIASAEQAQTAPPELTVLSAVAHGNDEQGPEVVRTAVELFATDGRLDDEQCGIYTDVVMTSLGAAARRALEKLMSTGGYQYMSEFARKYHAQGVADGVAQGEARAKADAILSFLKARGLAVPAEVEERVRACTDLATLDEWITRAAVVTNAEYIFG